MYRLIQVTNRKTRKQFVDMQWDIYRDDSNWVPPLKMDMHNLIKGKNNPLLKNGPGIFYIAVDDNDRVVGRIMAGVDFELLEEKTFKRGYLSMFESINDAEVAKLLLNAAIEFVNRYDMDEIYGPVSPTCGEDGRGLLIEGFEEEPALMNTYTMRYYPALFEACGFEKAEDEYAYRMDPELFPIDKYKKVVDYSMEKLDYRIDRLNVKDIPGEVNDLMKIIQVSREDAWDYFKTPTIDELMDEFQNLKMFIDPDFIYFARRNADSRPIGFVLALPDYNAVLKRLNGRLVTVNVLYFFLRRRIINRLRIFAQYVIPEYEGRGVNGALYYNVAQAAMKKGIVEGDASTISELNVRSRKSVETAGGILYKTFRYYRKWLKEGAAPAEEEE